MWVGRPAAGMCGACAGQHCLSGALRTPLPASCAASISRCPAQILPSRGPITPHPPFAPPPPLPPPLQVRVWKAEASAQQGVTLPREKHKQAYQKALVERYKHLPEVKKVVRHRNVPKAIHKVGCGSRRLGGNAGAPC